MKTKLEMAHEYAVAMLKTPAQLTGLSDKDIAIAAFNLAEAMQAEADKREPSGLPESLRERHDFTEAIAKGVENYEKKEWQPEWSQAPEWANWWAMDENKNTRWIYSELEQPYISDMFLRWCAVGRFDSADAPSFSYTGDWRNSLRKRPE